MFVSKCPYDATLASIENDRYRLFAEKSMKITWSIVVQKRTLNISSLDDVHFSSQSLEWTTSVLILAFLKMMSTIILPIDKNKTFTRV